MRVLVLGSGPSGMMAAHAANQYGASVDIWDKSPNIARRSSGVYYLHNDCDLLLDKVVFKQTILGKFGKTEDEVAKLYAAKVYRQAMSEPVSISFVKPEDTAFNAEQGVNRLWDLYGDSVKRHSINNFDDALKQLDNYEIQT